MAISTRSASGRREEGGCVVDFGARDPVGGVSVAIFIRHAGMTCAESGTDVSPSMGKILRWCGGLPIALFCDWVCCCISDEDGVEL